MENLKKNWLCKWHEEFDRFSPEHWKVSKLGLWWGPFIQSRRFMSLKFTGEFCVMTLKNDTKFEEALTCQFKIDKKNLTNFHQKFVSKICTLMGCFWRKYIIFVKKVQRSYVRWYWRLMQNLKENWLELSKMTWRIWQIFTCWKIAISF